MAWKFGNVYAGDNLGVGHGGWGWLCGHRRAEKIRGFKN